VVDGIGSIDDTREDCRSLVGVSFIGITDDGVGDGEQRRLRVTEIQMLFGGDNRGLS
jgi:hypothetical protein